MVRGGRVGGLAALQPVLRNDGKAPGQSDEGIAGAPEIGPPLPGRRNDEVREPVERSAVVTHYLPSKLSHNFFLPRSRCRPHAVGEEHTHLARLHSTARPPLPQWPRDAGKVGRSVPVGLL